MQEEFESSQNLESTTIEQTNIQGQNIQTCISFKLL